MNKKIFIGLLFIFNQSCFAQIPTNQTLLVNTEQKKIINDFKLNETKKIKEHRIMMHEKREKLKEQQKQLLLDIQSAKNNCDLTNEQKNSFRVRQYVIKDESKNLVQLNVEFMKKIREERLIIQDKIIKK